MSFFSSQICSTDLVKKNFSGTKWFIDIYLISFIIYLFGNSQLLFTSHTKTARVLIQKGFSPVVDDLYCGGLQFAQTKMREGGHFYFFSSLLAPN